MLHNVNAVFFYSDYQPQGEGEDATSEDELDQEEIQDLVFRFQALASSSQAVCIPQFDQEVCRSVVSFAFLLFQKPH